MKKVVLELVQESVEAVGGNVQSAKYRVGEPNIIKVEVEDYKEVNIDKLQETLDSYDMTVEYMGRSYGEFYFKVIEY